MGTTTGAQLDVSLFGNFKIVKTDGEQTIFSNRRARAVLALLCLAPGEPIRRELVSQLIWAGRFRPQARASLRQCLLELKRELQALGLNILEVSNTQLAVSAAAIHTDLQTLEAALDEGDHNEAGRLLTQMAGQYLLNDLDVGADLDSWVAAQRLQIESRLRIAVQDLSSALRGRGEYDADDALARAWDDWQGVSRSRARCRIALLPFDQVDEVGGDFFLAEGVVDELLSRLGAVNDISLPGRTSVISAAGEGLTVPELAAKLNVTHLVEGAVHRTSDQTTLTISLIDGAKDEQIWSDQISSYDGGFLGARETLSTNIINDLCKALGLQSRNPPARRMTANRDAYALYLQGRALTLRAVGDGVIAKGIELLETALERDPEFAECWSAIAEAHLYTAVFTPSLERAELAERMAAAARKAISLNPESGHARAMLGVYEFINHNPAGALDLAFEAHRLEPANVDVTVRLGSLLMYIGRTREAMPYIKSAIERDPVHGRTYIALCAGHLCLGEYDEAIVAGQRMVDLGIPGLWFAVMQAAAGLHEKAVETYRGSRVHLGTTIMRPPGMPPMDDAARDAYFDLAAKGVCSGKAEDRALYCQVLDGLNATMADPADPSIAFPAIWMGHAELVMKIYSEQMTLANMFGLMTLWSDSEPIRQTRLHPDFMSFAEDTGMVEAWEKYGWPDLIPTDPRASR